MTFQPIYDLESLTEAQRQEYYLSACEHYGIPPELNALAFIWMNSQDGKRTLTLYAKKAATDIIRANRGISTIRLTKDVGQGYVAWVAEGQDKTGRIEQAVGSAATDGFKGQALAMQVMLAQTRATRRMTLQFVGGILDESELPSTVSDISRSPDSLASLATLPAPVQPSVVPNTDAGKDVTEAPEPFSSGDITPETVETVEQVAAPAENKRRGRPRRSEIVLDSVTTPAPVVSLLSPMAEQETERGALWEPPTSMNIPTAESAQQALQGVIDPLIIKAGNELGKALCDSVYDMPSEAEEKAWRARLFVYTNDILPKGGMSKADGIIWKIRKYVQTMFPELPVKNGTVKLNNTQWRRLMDILDTTAQFHKPEGLVKVIEEVVAKA
jgi:hypothetical protein